MKPSPFEALRNFKEDRPVMNEKNQSVDFLLMLLLEEVAELQLEPSDGMSREKYLEQELVDVAIFAITILDILRKEGAESAIYEKICRNILKYPAYLFQEGDYDEAVRKSKQQWTPEDNKDFYN